MLKDFHNAVREGLEHVNMQDKLIKLWGKEAALSYLNKTDIKHDHEDLVIYHILVYTWKDLFWTQRVHPQELPPAGAMTGHKNYQLCSLRYTNSTAVLQPASPSVLYSQQPSELGSHFCWSHAVQRRKG